MPKTKKVRSAVSKERRLALALVALLDAIDDAGSNPDAKGDEVTTATDEADNVLEAVGYGDLKGIPRQVAALTTELKTATEAGEWARVAQLGQQLERVKAGKPLKSDAPAAGKKSSTKKPAKGSTASTRTPKAAAGTANGNEVEMLRKSIVEDFFKEDIEQYSAGKKLDAMDIQELGTLRDTLAALPA